MKNEMFEVTREWIQSNRTHRGGWIAAQIKLLGEQYPMVQGWMDRACGRKLTLEQKAAFEAAAVSKSKCRKLAKKLRGRSKASQVAALEEKLASGRVSSSIAHLVGGVDVRSDEFLRTWEWRELRYKTIKRYGPVCMCCGATPQSSGEPIQVDHIKPRSLFPWLAMDPENLGILCGPCNQGKSNKDFTDWRPKPPHDAASLYELDEESREHMRHIASQ